MPFYLCKVYNMIAKFIALYFFLTGKVVNYMIVLYTFIDTINNLFQNLFSFTKLMCINIISENMREADQFHCNFVNEKKHIYQ